MADRRRIERPEVAIEAVNTQVDEIKALMHIKDPKEKAQAFMDLYDVDTEEDAQREIMFDLCVKKMADVESLPTAKKTKTEIYNEYCMITGKSRRSAERYFKKVQKPLKKINNCGMVIHHAAAVAQDAISKMYDDLKTVNKQQQDIEDTVEKYEEFLSETLYDQIEEIQEELDRFPEKPNKDQALEIKSLQKELKKLDTKRYKAEYYIEKSENRISRLLTKKKDIYEQLMKYAKDFGMELSIKNTQNEINEQKNEILAQKVANDGDWQKADIYIRHKDMTPDQKRKALAQAISADKGLTETVTESFKARVIEDDSTKE